MRYAPRAYAALGYRSVSGFSRVSHEGRGNDRRKFAAQICARKRCVCLLRERAGPWVLTDLPASTVEAGLGRTVQICRRSRGSILLSKRAHVAVACRYSSRSQRHIWTRARYAQRPDRVRLHTCASVHRQGRDWLARARVHSTHPFVSQTLVKSLDESGMFCLQNTSSLVPAGKPAQVERPPAAVPRPTASAHKSVPADCAQQESSGSSSAEPSPLSANTIAAPAADGTGAATGTGKGGKALRTSADRQLRGMRSSSSSKSTMRTRSSASLDGLPPNQKSGRDARGTSPPTARVLSPAPEQTGGATQYNLQVRARRDRTSFPSCAAAVLCKPCHLGSALHDVRPSFGSLTACATPQGMPPPLPGCVWGLPMLPPPVPGLGGNAPMMMPMATPVSASTSQFYQPSNAMSAQWPQENSGCGSAVRTAPAGSLSTCMGQPPAGGAAARVFTAPSGQRCTQQEPPVKGGSVNTWSQEPDETAMGGMSWNDVDMLPFDDDADGDDALHQFSAELLADAPDTGGARGGGDGAEGVKGLVRGLPSDLNLAAADVGTDTLSWMDDTYLLDDGLGEKGAFLDMIA